MADLAYTAKIQNLIALKAHMQQYSALNADEKVFIDDTWASGAVTGGVVKFALTAIQQYAQAFYLGGAAAAPDVWEHLLVAEASLRVIQTIRPDRTRQFAMEREQAWANALDSFTLDAVTLSTLAGQTITMQGIRFYVLSALAKMKPRRFVSTASIDSETQWVLNYAWNRTGWNIRRRQCRFRVNRIALTGGTWTDSSKTLTKTGAFASYTHTNGARVRVLTGAADAVEGDYIVASKTSDNAIVLTTSIGAAADGDTDVAVELTWVTFVGLGASETFDSIATRELYFENTSGSAPVPMVWAGEDEMARAKASGSSGGRPQFFLTENRSGVVTWYFHPEPDATYSARGAVFISGPGTPANATETTVFDRFPTEMRPHLRDLVLGRVLSRHGFDETVWMRAVGEVDALFKGFEDAGSPDDSPFPRDVYHDADYIGGLGGAL